MSAQPPAFENADKCRRCSTTFGLFTRKHHCRACGRTFCAACSEGTMALPHLGLTDPVRVCSECERTIASSRNAPVKAAVVSSPAPAAAAVRAPREEPAPVAVAPPPPAKKVSNCTCGLPLCICAPDAAPTPAPAAAVSSSSSAAAAPVARKPVAAAPAAAAPSSFVGFGGSSRQTWDLRGNLNPQLRDAVKAKDVDGMKQLLGAGADASYVDHTGNSLAHLAAMFNRFDVVELLVLNGADLWIKNPSGETPVDLAPPALQRKMKELQPHDS